MKEIPSPSLECEEIPVEEAFGRILCDDVRAPAPVPSFPRSMVDGYAVLYRDIAAASEKSPSVLRIAGRVSIGEDASGTRIRGGECYIVDTGSYVPPNADLVVPFESAEEVESFVRISRPLPPGSNIYSPGSDVLRGQILAARGWRVDERVISSIASAGVARVRVVRRPRACLGVTGNELIAPGTPQMPGKIYESNLRALKPLLSSEGLYVTPLGVLRDDENEIEAALRRGVELCDVVIFTGGSSAGVDDLVYKLIEKLGRIVVRGIRYKPGKPLTLGIVGGRPVIGLPGNPVSAVMLLRTVLKPLIRILRGEDSAPVERGSGPARLLRRVEAARGRLTHVPSILVRGPGGVFALPWVLESFMAARLSLAEIYIEIPYTLERPFEAGDEILYHGLVESPRAWILEAGEIFDSIEISGTRLKIYVPGPEALRWLEMGASERAYTCAVEPGEVSGRMVFEERPGGSRIEAWYELLLREPQRRLPLYPEGSCFNEAIKQVGERAGGEGVFVRVNSPAHALELFESGYIDAAVRVIRRLGGDR